MIALYQIDYCDLRTCTALAVQHVRRGRKANSNCFSPDCERPLGSGRF